MGDLYGLSYSPWSEVARWALEHHRIPYTWHEHLPIFGVPLLRAKMKRWRGRISVPVYLDAGMVFDDSYLIAQHADVSGSGERLFPDGQDAALADWNRLSQEMKAAGRALLVSRIAADPEAQREALPAFVPALLRPPARPLAVLGIRQLIEKYRLDDRSTDTWSAILMTGLERIRQALHGGRPYLLDGFSFADIAMATALQFVNPVADELIALGPASRRCWTDPRFTDDYADLFGWRDEVYARDRHPDP